MMKTSPANSPTSSTTSASSAHAYGGDVIFHLYLREVGRVALLTRAEEIDLARRVQQGDDAAREQMIQANLRLVVRIASDFEGAGMPLLDLISEGNIGLMRAVEKYDPERGVKFSIYAGFWVRQAMRRGVANQSRTVRLPVHAQAKLFHINRATRRLYQLLDREPSDAELSAETGLPEANINRLRTAALRTVSLEAPCGEDDSGQVGDLIADEHLRTPDQELAASANLEVLQEAMAKLAPREQAVLRHRFGLDGDAERTLEDVGREFGVTREAVRQIQNRALKKLRREIEARDVTECVA